MLRWLPERGNRLVGIDSAGSRGTDAQHPLAGAIHIGTGRNHASHVYVYRNLCLVVPDPAFPDEPTFCLAFRVTIHLKDHSRVAIIAYPSNQSPYAPF